MKPERGAKSRWSNASENIWVGDTSDKPFAEDYRFDPESADMVVLCGDGLH